MSIDTVDWKLIGTCNLRCLHCYGPLKNVRALPLERLLEIVGKFKQLGVRTAVLTGCEPLLVRGISELLQALHEAGIGPAISTNGTLVKHYREEIRKYALSLNLALDGSTPELHARSRLDTKTYSDCLDALQYYLEHPEEKPRLIRVGTVYSLATRGDLLAIAEVLRPYMSIIDSWKIYELINHEVQPELREPIIHDHQDFLDETARLTELSGFGKKLKVAATTARNKAYFMINPAGQLVVPTDENGVTHDVIVGSLLHDDLDTLVANWKGLVDIENYHWNHGWYG